MQLYPRLLLWAHGLKLRFDNRSEIGQVLLVIVTLGVVIGSALLFVLWSRKPPSNLELNYRGMMYHCHPERYDDVRCFDAYLRYVGTPRRPR